MAMDIDKYVERVQSGKYSKQQLESLLKNASAREGAERVVQACKEALDDLGSDLLTKDLGFREVVRELHRRGVQPPDIGILAEGNKRMIVFKNESGKVVTLLTRSKRSGTWQTTTDYGVAKKENVDENEYWVFVDLEHSPSEFYVVPAWWIHNNIWETHAAYLLQNGGKRKYNDNSKHHSISEKVINRWLGKWSLILK